MENRGKKWTKDEETKLIEEIKSGKSLEDAAKNLGRSLKSIECRLRLIVCNNLENKEEIDKLLEIDNNFLKNAIDESQKGNLDRESFIKGIGKPAASIRSEEILEKFSATETRTSNLELLVRELIMEIKKITSSAREEEEEMVLL